MKPAAVRPGRNDGAAETGNREVRSPYPHGTGTDGRFGGRTVRTWTYGGGVPAAPIRVNAGDRLLVSLRNQLPDPTTVHWHGIALRNDMDGVPGVTMNAVPSGGRFDYSFIVPDPGTYWFHPHLGAQLDTGLQGALIVEDPSEPGQYDTEAIFDPR